MWWQMLLGKVPDDFHFEAKHKSNSYAAPVTDAPAPSPSSSSETVTAVPSEATGETDIVEE